MKIASIALCSAIVLGGFLTQDAHADSPLECAPTDKVDKYRMLRQLSLDLIGRIPTMEEYEKLDTLEVVDAATIEALLTTDEYFEQVRNYHRELVWAGLDSALEAVDGRHRLRRLASTNTWRLSNLRKLYRGRNNVECLDQPQLQFDAAGHPVPISTFADATCDDGICSQEGYVMVDPYWDLGTPIKVCAYDAQALATASEGGVACTSTSGISGCGCGDNLQYCLAQPTDATQIAIKDALAQEPTRIFESVVRQGRSYFDAFTTRTTFINGPLAHWYRHQTGGTLQYNGGIGFETRSGEIPNIAFSDTDTWVPMEREEMHAGVLTTPGFHLRFASNRSRVNRFYTAFRCEPFMAPADGLPPELEEVPTPNLRERPGCDVCHATIEVVAAHWGRWRTGGQYGYIDSEALDYETPLNQCIGCDGINKNCNAFCNRYFVTQQNASHPDELSAWEGFPLAREWLSEPEALVTDVGPSTLTATEADRNTVATCTVRTLSERYLGRELSAAETLLWLPKLTAGFADSGYNFTELVRLLVTSETYQRIR